MPLLYQNLLGAYEILTKNQADCGNLEGGRIEDVN